jgi:uncharacterized protein
LKCNSNDTTSCKVFALLRERRRIPMTTRSLTLFLLSELFGVCRLPVNSDIPPWALQDVLFSITRTEEELSVVCRQEYIPSGVVCEGNWRCLKVLGPLDFSLTGILAGLSTALAARGISLFAISTYDTDYIMVKAPDLEEALDALKGAGHEII